MSYERCLPAYAEFAVVAQPAVVIALLDRIEQLENELARASGLAQAKGEHACADDYMELAKKGTWIP